MSKFLQQGQNQFPKPLWLVSQHLSAIRISSNRGLQSKEASLQAFLEAGILTPEELEEVIISEFNPVRVGFQDVSEVYTENVLNCGVSPRLLIEKLKQRFIERGG